MTSKPFTNREFRSLLAALHPDSTTAERRHDAFVLLRARQIELRSEEKDKPLPNTYAETYADLMAMKPELAAARKAFRQKAKAS